MLFLAGIGKFLIGLFGLGIMIFIHELGHLLAAKLVRVKVDTFSIGFGKKLFGFRLGETNYQVAILPFGGFCKMKGEHLFTRAIEENLDSFPPDPDSYYNSPPWKRIIISLCGPLMNVLFAFLMFSLIFLIGFNEYTYPNKIIVSSDLTYTNEVKADLPVVQAGLISGDKIIEINSQPIRHYADLQKIIALSPNQKLTLKYEREDKIYTTEITPRLDKEYVRGYIGVLPYTEIIIDKINPATQALNPWLKAGDKIISLGEKEINNYLDLFLVTKEKPNYLPAKILRNGQIYEYNFYFKYDQASGQLMPGFSLAYKAFPTPRYNFFEAIGLALAEIHLNLKTLFLFFSLIPQKINIQNAIGGPLLTTYYIGEIAGSGLEYGLDQALVQFLQFICSLSVILFFMNLLPIPLLDGGYVLLFLIEWIRRKPYRPRFIYRYQLIGIAVLAILIIFVFLNDITKLFKL